MNWKKITNLLKKVEKDKSFDRPRQYLSNAVLTLMSILITIPLFIVVYRFVPDMILKLGNGIRIDHIVSFSVILVIIRYIVGSFKYIFIGLFVVMILFFTFSQIIGRYGFTGVYKDYLDLVSYMENNPVNIPFFKEGKMTIRNAAEIKNAIDYHNPEVREFAVKSSLEYFNNKALYYKYGNVIRYFSVFKVINKWDYVQDPKGEEYYALASASIKTLGGDCDDHSILMAACIKAIGGDVRIIHTKDHLYPEVKICKEADFLNIIYLIKRELFYKESLGQEIYYHIDDDKNIWLNFDYNGKFPGAKFMSNQIIGMLVI